MLPVWLKAAKDAKLQQHTYMQMTQVSADMRSGTQSARHEHA